MRNDGLQLLRRDCAPIASNVIHGRRTRLICLTRKRICIVHKYRDTPIIHVLLMTSRASREIINIVAHVSFSRASSTFLRANNLFFFLLTNTRRVSI